jgi:hypothetical protein
MLAIFRIKLVEAIRSLHNALTAPVIRDDDGDDGDIATPKTCIDHEI